MALGALRACVRVGAFSQDQLSGEKKENYPHLYKFLRSDRCRPLLCCALCDYLREERKCLVPTCTDSCQSFTKSGCVQPQHENSISQDTQGTPQQFPPLGTSEHSGQGVHVCVSLVITAHSEIPKFANRQHSLQNATLCFQPAFVLTTNKNPNPKLDSTTPQYCNFFHKDPQMEKNSKFGLDQALYLRAASTPLRNLH